MIRPNGQRPRRINSCKTQNLISVVLRRVSIFASELRTDRTLLLICAIIGILLKLQDAYVFLFKKTFFVILNKSDILFGCDYNRENQSFQAVDDNSPLEQRDERVVIMRSYADVIEVKRTIVHNYAFVRQLIETKRKSVKFFVRRELRLHSNANAKLRFRLVAVIALVRDLKAV